MAHALEPSTVAQGMTIKGILGKVDMFNFNIAEKEDFRRDVKKNLLGSSGNSSDPMAAYLGPKLWENTISLPFDLDPFGVDGIQEVLAENNIKVDYEESSSASSPPPMDLWLPMYSSPVSSPEQDKRMVQPARASIFSSTQPKRELVGGEDFVRPGVIKIGPGPVTPVIKEEKSFLYAESKRARLEREKEERKVRMEQDIEFSPEDLALATVPGYDFDPKHRSFHLEELRPQPIIRKRKKIAVPEEAKDDRYWEKRNKNKQATRRSREARRLKENQIALRAAFLERENRELKEQVDMAARSSTELKTETEKLRERLRQYEGANF